MILPPPEITLSSKFLYPKLRNQLKDNIYECNYVSVLISVVSVFLFVIGLIIIFLVCKKNENFDALQRQFQQDCHEILCKNENPCKKKCALFVQYMKNILTAVSKKIKFGKTGESEAAKGALNVTEKFVAFIEENAGAFSLGQNTQKIKISYSIPVGHIISEMKGEEYKDIAPYLSLSILLNRNGPGTYTAYLSSDPIDKKLTIVYE